MDYFRSTGIFPIMHVTTIKQEIVDKYPWVTTNLVKAFEQAKLAAYRRVAESAHGAARLGAHRGRGAGGHPGRDPWTYGLTPVNRKTLETIQRYTHQQGMVGKLRPLDELFEDTDLGDSGGSEEYDAFETHRCGSPQDEGAGSDRRNKHSPHGEELRSARRLEPWCVETDMNFQERLADIRRRMRDEKLCFWSPCMTARISSRSPIR